MADIINNMPVGFKFKPKDDELINCYLLNKVLNQPLPPNKITQLDISDYTPMQLREFPNYGEKEMYFFTSRDRKYPKGKRPDRKATDNGFWKASGADKPVYASNGVQIGLKKALVFYFKIDKKQVKTNWIMQEYRVPDGEHKRTDADDMKLDECVLCKIYQTDRTSLGKRSREEDDGTQTNDSAVQSDETSEMVHGNEDGLKQENDHIHEPGVNEDVILYPPTFNYDHYNSVQWNHHSSELISQTNASMVQYDKTSEMEHRSEDCLKQENGHIHESGLNGDVILYPPMLNYDHCNSVQWDNYNSGFISQTEGHGLNDQTLQEEEEFDLLEFLNFDHDDLL